MFNIRVTFEFQKILHIKKFETNSHASLCIYVKAKYMLKIM